MLCRPLVVESEHYAFSPPRSGAGRLQGRLGILRTLCVLHRLTRGPGKNTQIPGSRGNISQSAPSPRLMEDKSPPPLRSPHRRGSPASIQYSDPRAESDKGVAGWQGVSARFPSLPHGIRPCQSASGPFPRPCGQGCCVLDQAAGPGRSPTGDSPKLGPAHPGGPVES